MVSRWHTAARAAYVNSTLDLNVELQSASLEPKQSLESGLVELIGSIVRAVVDANNAIEIDMTSGKLGSP